MRRTIVLLTMMAAVVLAFSAAALAQPAEPTSPQPSSAQDFAPGEVLVKFEPGARGQDIANIHRQNGGHVKETIGGIDVQVVGVPRGQEKSSVARYQHNPNVRYAELNGVYEADGSVTNDPRVGEQWAFNNTGQTGGTADADINAFEAWNGGSTTDWKAGNTGSAAVPIAVLDSGIKEDHEDLKGKVTKRINFVCIEGVLLGPPCPNSTTSDVYGHGTHVAGTVAAATNNVDSSGNYVGVAGTCPGCVLYNVKVLADDGPGYSSWAAKGIIWSADNGAKVINMSLGSPSGSSALQDAVNYAWGKGVVVVAAAGNDGTSSPHYPAAYENVIAVGATDSKDQRVVSSTWSSNFGSWVDVVAPGSSILSTMNKVDDPSTKVDESYGYMQGTSMASPHVAGLAGLLASKGYSNSEIRYRIEKTAIDLGTTGKDVEYGYGRIDARDAFACVPDTCPPTVKPPVKSISASSQLVNTSTVPVNLNWFSSDRGGSGIARYELQKSTDFGASWSNVTLLSPTANSPTLYLLGDSYYRFRVRAQDKVGHWSTWAEGPTFKVHKPYQENNPAVSYPSGTWTTSISSAVSGGYFKGSTTCFATAKFSFTGSEVAWVATKSLAYGKVQVRVDGVSYAVVDLSSGTPQTRTPVLQKRWSSSGPHTIEVIKTVDYINPKTGYMACDPSRGVNVDAFTVLG